MRNGTEIQPVVMPFPSSHMKTMNCYALPGEDGWTLIDAGPDTEEAKAVWLETLEQRGFRFSDVKQIVMTHHHNDHIGLAHWLQEQTGAPVKMSQISYDVYIRPHDLEMLEGLLRGHQLSEEQTQGILEFQRLRNSWKQDFERVEILDLDKQVLLGQDWYDLVTVGGHAAGHLCFYDPKQLNLICADSVMQKFIPNINYTPEFEPNPIQNYFEGLDRLALLTVNKAYPGHGVPFEDFYERIVESGNIVKGKVEKFLSDLHKYKDLGQVYNKKGGRYFAPAQGFFVFCELIAYVRYLESRGLIEATVKDGLISFEIAEETAKAGL